MRTSTPPISEGERPTVDVADSVCRFNVGGTHVLNNLPAWRQKGWISTWQTLSGWRV